ncbi:MAG: DUF4375 domain-containing protein, partial [Woeseiaceae bacterium]|nr:DUF4375 domain-containing protein [Woeseiaceae bacterium]
LILYGAVAALLLVSYVVNIGFSRAWGRWPGIVSLVILAGLALVGYFANGTLQSAVLARGIWLWELYAFGHLGVSFILSAMLATPGCEMRAFHDLFARLTGAQARVHACPLGPMTYVDAWEAGKSSASVERYDRVSAELARRHSIEDWELLGNIAMILLDKRERDGMESLTRLERHLIAIDAMTREVNNGGFHQFFGNPSGEFAYDLVPALEAVGSVEFRELAAEAIAVFGTDRSLDEDARYERLDALTGDGERDPWEHIEERFFVCGEPVETLAIDYAISNIAEFDD